MIRQQVLSSFKWLAGTRLVGQLATWAMTVLTIRLLSPSDYGLMAYSTLVLGLLALVNEMGLGAALIQRKELDNILIRRIFGLNLVANTGFFLLVVAIAGPVAIFFDEGRLVDVLRVSSLGFLLGAFGIVPGVLLARRMDFRRKAFVDLASTLSAGAGTLALAYAGLGVWALVWGQLFGSGVRVVGMILAAGTWYAPSFALQGIGKLVSFGGSVAVTRVLWYVYSQADVLIVGKLLGKDLLGIYSVAVDLATIPMQKVTGILNEIGFAAFSRVQADRTMVRENFLKVVGIMSFFAFPVFVGISAITPEAVYVLLGPNWEDVIVPMKMITLVIPLRMIANLIAPAVVGVGHPDIIIKNTLTGCVVMPLAFVLGSPWGLLGVSLGWGIAYPILFVFVAWQALPVLGVSLKDCFRAMRGGFIASFVMYLTVMAEREAMTTAGVPTLWILVLLIVSGVLVYSLMSLWVQRSMVREVLDLAVT